VLKLRASWAVVASQKEELPTRIEGAPNFRQVEGKPVYGCAIPTFEGIRNTLRHTSTTWPGKSSLGDAKSSLGDAGSSLGDAKSSLGDAKSSLGDAGSSLGDVYRAAAQVDQPA
jgi:hypothetical protein